MVRIINTGGIGSAISQSIGSEAGDGLYTNPHPFELRSERKARIEAEQAAAEALKPELPPPSAFSDFGEEL